MFRRSDRVHNACDPGDLLANGGGYLGGDGTTIISVHGNKFTRLPDGTFENIGPASAEEIELAGVVVQPLDSSVGTNSFATWVPNTAGFDDLAQFRDELGLPRAGSAADRSTLAVVEVNGQQIYGINGHGQSVTGVNAISRTHAEIDALNQIQQRGIDVSGQKFDSVRGSYTMHSL